MLILSIETTGPVSSVAIDRDGEIKVLRNYESYSHLKGLMPEVSDIMAQEGIKGSDLDAIAISQGPGSFTGIRIGMVSAKGLAQVWNKPIIEVPSLAAFAYNEYDFETDEHTLFATVLDAKMHQVYGAAYKKNYKTPVIVPRAYSFDEYIELVRDVAPNYSRVVFIGDALKTYESEFNSIDFPCELAPASTWNPDAYGVSEVAEELFSEGAFKTCYTAQPEYLRLPEAERKFRTKTLNLRSATPRDIEAVVNIENACFTDPWSRSMLLEEIEISEKDETHVFTVADDNGQIVAYLSSCLLPGISGELWSIATTPERKRQGIAKRMLLELLAKAKEQNIKTVLLEVRAGNVPAICLYESIGFKRVGVRPGYYSDGEDAILMDKDL